MSLPYSRSLLSKDLERDKHVFPIETKHIPPDTRNREQTLSSTWENNYVSRRKAKSNPNSSMAFISTMNVLRLKLQKCKKTISVSGPQFFHVITAILLVLSISSIPSTTQQHSYCPKQCTCDDQNLEMICKENLHASSVPHTLNPNTKRVVLNYGQTASLTGVDYLAKLEALDLAYNRIAFADFDILTKNVNLIYLNISNNLLNELRDSSLMNALTELNLNLSSFSEPVEADNIRALKLAKISVVELILTQNTLTTLRNLTFIRWHKLQQLDLSYNQISVIEPLALFGLNKIENLNLRHNRIVQIPTLALQSTVLSISSPSFTTLPHSKPSSLKHLDISENSLISIGPESFTNLEKAQNLILESCSIENIDDKAFKGLHTLYLLTLDKNNLMEVPKRALSYLGMLRILKLNGNNISTISKDDFNDLAHLEELQLNNGTLSRLQIGAFNGLESLKKLEIAENHNLSHIDTGTFDNLPRLAILNLKSNSLSSISESFGDRLTILDLRGNPLICMCNLKWLTSWLRRFNTTAHSQKAYTTAQSYDVSIPMEETQVLLADSALSTELLNLTCHGPPALHGKLVVELPDNKLECLHPTSDFNVRLGFATLFLLALTLTLVCLLNFCRNKKHLLVMLKENLVQGHMSMMIPYSENLHGQSHNSENLKKETQLYGPDYETIDYHGGQVFTVSGEQVLPYSTIAQQYYSQQIQC